MFQFYRVVQEIQNVFDTIPCMYMLMNGNVEIPLKFFVGSCFEGNMSTFSYSMDKKVEGHEIDMIAFDKGIELFATEFKCTFSYDKYQTKKAAIDACGKIMKTSKLKMFKYKPKYIVHFLNHSRQDSNSSSNPKWIKDKSPDTKVVKAESLVEIYRENLNEKITNSQIIKYNFGCQDLGLDAILISL